MEAFMGEELLVMVGVYLVLSIVILLIAFFILRSILRGLRSVWSYSGTLFGDDTKTRLIGFGVSALLFSRVVSSIANFIIGSTYAFFLTAPQQLISAWGKIASQCQQTQNCIFPLSNELIDIWTKAASVSLNYLSPNRFPYNQLIFLLTTWAIITLVFDLPNDTGGADRPGSRRRKVPQEKPTKQNFIFFTILGLASYLSIVSIITIPSLQEPPSVSEEVKVERLEGQLNEIYTQWKDRVPPEPTIGDPFADLDKYLKENPASSQESLIDIENYRGILDGIAGQYKVQVENASTQLESIKSQAVLEYETTSANRKGSFETVEHFSSLVAWYRRAVNQQDAQIKACQRNIASIEGVMNLWAQSSLADLESNGEFQNPFDFTSYAPVEFQQACATQSSFTEQIPERPELGSNLGTFSTVASWLLKTESLPLAQIVGMLGFGLLGSAASSLIVNYKDKRNKNHPIVDDLGTFIIRGATAALVVFLSVKGGLAIFTSGGGEPNSYVLLFTCLVAAVFSEKVWIRAGEWLEEQFGKGDDAPPKPKDEAKGEADPKTASTEQTGAK
jgi:hypothetical protein